MPKRRASSEFNDLPLRKKRNAFTSRVGSFKEKILETTNINQVQDKKSNTSDKEIVFLFTISNFY